MDRRGFMKEAIILVGGVGALTVLPGCSWQEAPQTLSADVKARVARIIDLMMPRTASFGAIDAGAHEFFDSLMANWASDKTRGDMIALLDDAQLSRLPSMPDADAAQALARFDAAAFAAQNKAWGQFKQLAMLGFVNSERYQTEIAQYQLVPGRYDPCVALAEQQA